MGIRFPSTSLGTTQSLTRGMFSRQAKMTSAIPSSSALFLSRSAPLSSSSSASASTAQSAILFSEVLAAGYAQPQERLTTSIEATLLVRAQVS